MSKEKGPAKDSNSFDDIYAVIDNTSDVIPLVPPAPIYSFEAEYVGQVWIMATKAAPSRFKGSRAFERWIIRTQCDGYVHVEIAFKMMDGQVYALTVDKYNANYPGSGFVRFVYKDIANPEVYHSDYWQAMALHLTKLQIKRLFEFCKAQIGKPMDQFSMYMNFVPGLSSLYVSGPQRRQYDKYFCSLLVATAFKFIEIPQFANVDARKSKPSTLVELFMKMPTTLSQLRQPDLKF